jgi:translation initiation factor IF-3
LDTKKRDFTPINHQIRNNKVLCIDHENNNLGLIETSKALEIARSNELDLVQVSFSTKDNVPTCKILDYGKYKYILSLNEKAAKKKQRESEIKVREIKMRPATAENDIKIKAVKAQEILDDGDKVKISIVFKGRELNYKENAFETYDTFISFLPDMEIVEGPNLMGKVLSAMGEKRKDIRIHFIEQQSKKIERKSNKTPDDIKQLEQDKKDIEFVEEQIK